MSYDNSKQVILSKVTSDNEKAPALRVQFEVNGQKYKAGLWVWTRKDGTRVNDKEGNAQYIGDWEEDNYAQQVQDDGIVGANKALNTPASQAADINNFDDDIPF